MARRVVVEADSAARSAARRESWVVAKVEGWRGDIVGVVGVFGFVAVAVAVVVVVVVGGEGGGGGDAIIVCGYMCRCV